MDVVLKKHPSTNPLIYLRGTMEKSGKIFEERWNFFGWGRSNSFCARDETLKG
jgi:hypothetical protein